jgi:hypothetical protein
MTARGRGVRQYWRLVHAYQQARPELTTREVRGDPYFRRLYERYRELAGQREERHRGERGEPWRRFAQEYREVLEELGVEDDAESRQLDWGS